jgi:hypothetical protein
VAAIISNVTTPLALAALVVLILAQILLVIARRPDSRISEDFAKYLSKYVFIFLTGVVLIGAGAWAFQMVQDRDLVIRGTVVSKTDGMFVRGASVDVAGGDQRTTDSTGRFEVSVPRSRLAEIITIRVHADGFKPAVFNVRSSDVAPLSIELEREVMSLLDIGEDVVLGHYFGYPAIGVTLRFSRAYGEMPTTVGDFQVDLTTPTGSILKLSAAASGTLSQRGPFSSVLPVVQLDRNQELEFQYLFMEGWDLAEPLKLIQKLPEYRQVPPCTGAVGINDAAWSLFMGFMMDNFRWVAGDWHFRIRARVNTAGKASREIARTGVLRLSEQEVAGLKASSLVYEQCAGVNVFAPFARAGGVATFIDLRLREKS